MGEELACDSGSVRAEWDACAAWFLMWLSQTISSPHLLFLVTCLVGVISLLC